MPKWTVKLEEEMDEIIKETAVKYHIDLGAVGDSRAIEDGKELIKGALVRLYWNYNVQDRERLEEFEKEINKKGEKKRYLTKAHKKKIGKGVRRSHRKTKLIRYPKEMEAFVRFNVNKTTNKGLVELIQDKFGIKTTTNRLTNYMALRGIRRKK